MDKLQKALAKAGNFENIKTYEQASTALQELEQTLTTYFNKINDEKIKIGGESRLLSAVFTLSNDLTALKKELKLDDIHTKFKPN